MREQMLKKEIEESDYNEQEEEVKEKKVKDEVAMRSHSWEISITHDEVKEALMISRSEEMKIFYVDPGLTKFAQVTNEEEKFYQWGGGDILQERSPWRDFYKVYKFMFLSLIR